METVLIIGGASGIGLAASLRFIENSYNVIVIDKDGKPDVLSNNILAYRRVNILDEDAIQSTMLEIGDHYHVDHIIVTAGGANKNEVEAIKNDTDFWKIDYKDIQETIKLNLVSQIMLVGLFLRVASDCEHKSITLISSINSLGRYGLVGYSSAKAGLEGFVRSSAENLGHYGVRINCIAPGSTRTPLTISEGMDFEAVKKQTLLGRVTESDDIAEVIYFLVSSKAITGQCIICDSGQSLKSLSRY